MSSASSTVTKHDDDNIPITKDARVMAIETGSDDHESASNKARLAPVRFTSWWCLGRANYSSWNLPFAAPARTPGAKLKKKNRRTDLAECSLLKLAPFSQTRTSKVAIFACRTRSPKRTSLVSRQQEWRPRMTYYHRTRHNWRWWRWGC